jgi:predicted NAD/FAD-binding protein
MKIAVIGSGISGLSAAWFLARRHQVTLFEADSRPGGHTNTVEVQPPGGGSPIPIDTGFIVCNPVNYPNFYRFLDELGVALRNSDMSLGVSVAGGRIEWAGDEDLSKVFAQPGLLFSPSHWQMLRAVMRFNAHVKRLLAENALPTGTLGEFLATHRYPMALRVRYVAAMAGPIWSTSTAGAMEFPFAAFAKFFDSHGLLNVYERPQWQTVVGGSRSYVQRVLETFRGQLQLNTPVLGIRRTTDQAILNTRDGEASFDAVVCATHSDQALAMLHDASADERAVLAGVPYARNRAWLHTDAGLMPRRRRAWSAWNALLTQDRLSDDPIAVSYWMNKLQEIPLPSARAVPSAVKDDTVNYFVTLNPAREPRAETVLYQTDYTHPVYRPETIAAQQALAGIQRQRSVVWAGAWTGYGFHEDGFKSGLRAVAALDRSCLPSWAKLDDTATPAQPKAP